MAALASGVVFVSRRMMVVVVAGGIKERDEGNVRSTAVKGRSGCSVAVVPGGGVGRYSRGSFVGTVDKETCAGRDNGGGKGGCLTDGWCSGGRCGHAWWWWW